MIVGLTGLKGSGKTTAADFLHNYHSASFADGVREVVACAFDASPEALLDRDLKKSTDEFWGITYRKMLQRTAMAFREKFGDDFWIAHLESKIDLDEDIVIDDVRFPNEAQWVRDNGGVVIGLLAHDATLDDDAHVSEQAMYDQWFDITDAVMVNPKEGGATLYNRLTEAIEEAQ